jgi:hypothetical protein
MGNFYTNVLTRGVPQPDLMAELRALGRTAYVLVCPQDFTIVCDREAETQRDGVIDSLALTLAARTRSPALAALNHDDDCLVLWLFLPDGTLTQFGWKRARSAWDIPGGSRKQMVERVRQAFGTEPRQRPRVADAMPALPFWRRLAVGLVLRLGQGAFAVGQHQRIAQDAGLPEFVAGAGYRYVDNGEFRHHSVEVRRV